MKLALPPGVADQPPPEAERLGATEHTLLRLLRRHGYRRLRTPLIELDSAVAHGLSAGASERAFRMVDPETGEALVLRPDLTPQVARHLAMHPPQEIPVRLAYSGCVYRVERRPGGAPRERHQTGAELVGWAGPEADLELIELALACLREALGQGAKAVVFALGDAAVLQALVGSLGLTDPEDQARVTRALARKAFDDVTRRVAHAGGDRALAARLSELTGPPEFLDRWLQEPWPAPVRSALEGFAARARGLTQAPDGPRVLLDCTEVRDRRYYTGVVFEAFAPGSGRPVLAGGRYDTFYGGFGLELPAAGFAVDRAALLEAGAGSEPLPVLRVGSSERTEDSGRHLVQVLDALRGAGYDAARAPGLSAERLEPSPWVLVEGATLRFNLGPSEERGTLDDLLAHLAAAP